MPATTNMSGADVGAQWHVKHESGMYQEPQFPQGQVYSHGDVKDKFASPFAASGVQVEEMSHNYFPSEFPAPAYSQKSGKLTCRCFCVLARQPLISA